jgi:DNA-binding MarR family transcriptional regulator
MATRPLSITAQGARGAALLAKRVEVALVEVDLTPPQYRLLALLEVGSSTATYAAERLAVSPPSVTSIVDGLVARSMVERKNVEGDRRRVHLELTDEGFAALERGDKVIAAELEHVASLGGDHGDASVAASDALSWWSDAIRSEYASRADR